MGSAYCAATAGTNTSPSADALLIIQPSVRSESGAVGIGRITAANVAMYAAEPDLLHCLAGQRWNRRSPKRGGKFGAPFVDGHGVISIQDIRVQSRIEEAVNERTDAS